MREWKRQHPTGDPDDYLITHEHKQTSRDGGRPGDKLDQLDTLSDDPEIKQLLHERLDEYPLFLLGNSA